MSQNSLPAPSYIVRIRCLLPSSSSQPNSLIVTPNNSSPVMATTTKNTSSDSFGFASPKESTPQTSCNICKRLLYSFEEVLLCRVCHNLYHWRCVKPETISHYGEHGNYVCDSCNDGTTSTLPHRITNGSIKTKSTDTINTDYRDFPKVQSKTSSSETNVVSAIRYFEEKQQQQQSQTHKTIIASDLDGYLPIQTNGNAYDHHNSQYNNDSRTTRRLQQQRSEVETDEENDSSAMFQANYEYTPLQDYAAMKNSRTTNENNTNGYRNSPSDNTERPTTSRYGGGLHYSNHGYDPTVSRLVEVPSSVSTHFTSPTLDNLSIHNRQHHFTSTTNLNVNEKASRRPQQPQQQTSLVHSTPYLSQLRDDDSPIFKQQQQTDHHSTVGSDSGIVIINPNSHQRQQQQQQQHHHHSDENQVVEKKLTDLVQQLGKQLETDAQKINEKLELKLKNLENMINQQTYIIRRQDEVIERLKSKILKIETERDHFRDRLSVHEQQQHYDEKKHFTNNETKKFNNHENDIEYDNRSNRRSSNASTTDNNRPSTKKTPAPRIDQQWSTTTDESNKPTIAKLIKSNPADRERLSSDSSSAPSMIQKLVSPVPVVETPGASTRLDDIIHQSSTIDVINSSSSNYSLAQVRRQDRQVLEPISMEQQQVVTSIHHEDDDDDDDHEKNTAKPKRTNMSTSSSSSLSSNSSKSTNQPAKSYNLTSTNNATSTTNRNPNVHRSLESLQNTYQNNQGLKSTNKAASLELGTKPVRYDDPSSIYITPVEASQPANQSNSVVKGWLRKQNRDSFLKRIERYYCVLTQDALLLHRHENDRTPHKAVNLKGAKVFYYDDNKYGPSLELTWSSRTNNTKHYHLYAPNPQEAEHWVTGIQTTVHNLETKTKWQSYRMNT